MKTIARNLTLVAVTAIAACETTNDPTQEEAQLANGLSPLQALTGRLTELATCQTPEEGTRATFPPQVIQGEAPPLPPNPPLLYAFYNISGAQFENAFTTQELNSGCEPPAAGAIGAIRTVVEPKTGLVIDPNDPRSFIDIFTDVCHVRVINNESGWYETWFLHDLVVPEIAASSCAEETAVPFGRISADDARTLEELGTGQNVPGNLFTLDGLPPHGATPDDPAGGAATSNLFPVFLSLGAWNTLQGTDGHAYWELNEYTNWSQPLYEYFTTGGIPGTFAQGFQYGPLGGLGPQGDSRIPSSGPKGTWTLHNTTVVGKTTFGDDPNSPRDPDRTPEVCQDDAARAESRLRFIPSGLARQILVDALMRLRSFEPQVTDFQERLYDAYVFEVSKIDTNHDGIVQFGEADIEDTSDGGQPNTRLYISPTQYNRAWVTREINDGLLLPRFAPTARAVIMAGALNLVQPVVPVIQ